MLSRADKNIVARDEAVPGLQLLLDEELLLEAIGSQVSGIQKVKVYYVRYKPGTSCLVGFRLHTEKELVYGHAIAIEAASRHKLDRIRKTIFLPGIIGPGYLDLHNEAATIFFFPNDARIPGLLRLVDANEEARLLRRVFGKASPLALGKLSPLRYKPGRRFVTCLHVDGEPVAVLKLYADDEYELAREGGCRVATRDHLTACTTVAHADRYRTLAFPWIKGDLLSHVLADPAQATQNAERTGIALAELHAQGPLGWKPLPNEGFVSAMLSVASFIGRLCPELSGTVHRLAEQIARALPTPGSSVPIHGDFYADQVITTDSRVVFIDFDRSAHGAPLIDTGNFIAHLEWSAIRGLLKHADVETAREGLVRGYQSVRGPVRTDHLTWYTAAAIILLTPNPFRMREIDWFQQTEALLQRAEQLVNQASRSKQYSLTAHPGVEPASYGKDLTIAFPAVQDPHMPFLQQALNPVVAQELVAPLLARSNRGDSYPLVRSVRLIRHKPGRRCLIEYVFEETGADERTRSCSLLGKARARGLDRATYDLSSALWSGDFGPESEDGVAVPEPIGCVPDLHMWLQHRVPGEVATSTITGAQGTHLVYRIVHAISKLHRQEFLLPRRHTIANEVNILRERLPSVLELHPGWSQRLRDVLAGCTRLAASITEPVPLPVHRDFYSDNVLIGGDRVWLIDLDLACMGDPALDAGNFIAHLIEQSIRTTGSRNTYKYLEELIEDVFAGIHGASVWERVQVYTTLSLVRHIHISTQISERRAFTEYILDICEERLYTHPFHPRKIAM